ncbi:citrate lyase subunit beta/citryl-CoA lyase [Rhodococcus sp. SMB37]|uniref:HpcH/HpaI aldolase/citrate lyase family protein n=1 Tax=Rhodococcus sp. SMB37 TaxID=2512213 RepID=UPI00105013F5|nr:CoA ester lyase [Rhodococcus sp. SMB37]TCN53984.1 citrate lyase subunit beta/citryl-CoA lyase [Rhodococcus sp. SMB37]
MSVIPGPAWLFCPADRPERYGRAAATADVVVLDLDDGVAPADKDYARRSLLDRSLDPARTVVRIGPSGTDEHRQDLRALADSPYTRVMLARCESPEQVTALAPLEVIALVESPRGVLAVADIALAMGTIGVMWGAESLAVGLGGQTLRHADGAYRDVAKHVRSSVLLAAKAYGRWALDAAYLDIGDHAGLRSEALDAVAVGFDVKVAIHPDQVGVIREAYTPSAESVEWARRVLAAVPESRGVFRFEGRMVDAPVLRHAEQILHRSVEARANGYRSGRTEVEPERR